MNEILEQTNYWISQAYLYIPAVLGFITAVGLPCIVSVCKIVANTKIWLSQAKTFLGKINSLVKAVNQLNELVSNLKDELVKRDQGEIEFLKNLELVSFNKKQQAVINDRVKVLERDISAICENHGIENVDELIDAELDNPKKRLKAKVKKAE